MSKVGRNDVVRCPLIGIGSLLAEAPSHTTGHAGPHPAIRLIKADHQLSKYNPSDLK